jgi:hypothetical protein
MPGNKNSQNKKGRGQRKAAQKLEQKQRVLQARETRRLALDKLREAGCFVFMMPEEWENESVEQMLAWDARARIELLTKSPGFLIAPEAISETEKIITGFRMACSMVKTVRYKYRTDVLDGFFGESDSGAKKWEKGLGVKEGVFVRQKFLAPSTEKEWSELWDYEREKGVGFSIKSGRHKGRYDIPECVERIEEFRQSWLLEEDPNVLGQNSDAQVPVGNGVGDKRRRERPVNLSEGEFREALKLRRDERQFKYSRADKGGAATLMSSRWFNDQCRKHAESESYVPAEDFSDMLRSSDSIFHKERWYEGAGGKRWRSSLDF